MLTPVYSNRVPFSLVMALAEQSPSRSLQQWPGPGRSLQKRLDILVSGPNPLVLQPSRLTLWGPIIHLRRMTGGSLSHPPKVGGVLTPVYSNRVPFSPVMALTEQTPSRSLQQWPGPGRSLLKRLDTILVSGPQPLVLQPSRLTPWGPIIRLR